MPEIGAGAPRVIGPGAVGIDEVTAIFEGTLAARARASVIELTGPGVVECVQGILTNDVEKPGDESMVYGAVLTPKGMIVCDAWAIREGARVTLVAPNDGVTALTEALARSLPPRLAKWVDRSGELAVLRLSGGRAHAVSHRAGIAIPEPGRAGVAIAGRVACRVGRPAADEPFALQCVVPARDTEEVLAALRDAGATVGSDDALELSRVLAGWPHVGAETDAKTLPQEVRFDQIGGVSYTKGCYTGQETVARVHFRGHPNRHLVGLAWDAQPDESLPTIKQGGRERGRVTTIVWMPIGERWLGLGVVRRETDPAEPVLAGGTSAVIVDLPFRFE